MREKNEGNEEQAEEARQSPSLPQKGQAEGGEAEREVVIEEAHVEGIAVSEHGDARSKKPGWPATGSGDESKDSPEKNEHAERDDKFFGQRKTEVRCGVLECPIEENVVPLAHDVEAR